jgi:hypothetical protein
VSSIRFRKVDHTEEKIYIEDDFFLGKVKKNVWTQKWSLHPIFKTNSDLQSHTLLYSKYDSFYKAGKAMVQLYNIVFGEDEKEQCDSLGDTDEFDMRGISKSWGP